MDTSRAAVRQRVAAFRQQCAALGVALTPQRLAIYAALAGDDSHPAADELFRRVKPRVPSLALGTVYRTLELFEAHGLIRRVHTLGDQARFDANRAAHHHLVCVRCRRVRDYESPALDALPLPETADGFRVLSHVTHLLGVCAACRAREATAP
jgi:Fur family peroxide stress response transcriptional regulator